MILFGGILVSSFVWITVAACLLRWALKWLTQHSPATRSHISVALATAGLFATYFLVNDPTASYVYFLIASPIAAVCAWLSLIGDVRRGVDV
jgi:flagellar biosynthesis protein FliP